MIAALFIFELKKIIINKKIMKTVFVVLAVMLAISAFINQIIFGLTAKDVWIYDEDTGNTRYKIVKMFFKNKKQKQLFVSSLSIYYLICIFWMISTFIWEFDIIWPLFFVIFVIFAIEWFSLGREGSINHNGLEKFDFIVNFGVVMVLFIKVLSLINTIYFHGMLY